LGHTSAFERVGSFTYREAFARLKPFAVGERQAIDPWDSVAGVAFDFCGMPTNHVLEGSFAICGKSWTLSPGPLDAGDPIASIGPRLYALDSTTDRPLSFAGPWPRFPPHKAAVNCIRADLPVDPTFIALLESGKLQDSQTRLD